MPQQTYWPQYYSTSATTNNYIPANYSWKQTPSYQITTSSPQLAWLNWNATTNSTLYQTYTDESWTRWVDQNTYRPRVYTPEEMRDIEARQERHRVITEERTQRRAAARTRARLLLEQFLDDEQRAELEKGRFHVTGSKGRRYCIRLSGQQGNVDLLRPDGGVQATLCCHPRHVPDEHYELLPEGDAWLMQMIEIRHDEDNFLRTANVHRGSLPALAA